MKWIVLLLFLFQNLHGEEVPVLYQGRYRPIEASEEPLEKMCLIPLELGKGNWVPLSALQFDDNFTPYSNQQFQALRKCYQQNQLEDLFSLLYKNYKSIAGKSGYPSILQLKIEALYLKIPIKLIILTLYLIGLLFRPSAIAGFICHTLLLCARCYILERPPVTSMFETLLFVSWIMVFASLFLPQKKILIGSGALIFSLSFLMKDQLGTLQPVLNSSSWLMIHVLTVTSSYGFFLLSAALGHWYLLRKNEAVFRSMMHMNFLGVFLLVTGTILGALWAEQSWGRLWDWDPKETWAFIAICAYLVLIHAFHSKKFPAWAIALGSCIACLFITFNWYGVNFLLGKGLHSYGFEKGGSIFYFLFLAGDLLFLAAFLQKKFVEKKFS